MIETVNTGDYAARQAAQTAQNDGEKKVLHWRKNERMGGYVPVWEQAKPTSQTAIADNLSHAINGGQPESFDSAMAYAETQASQNQTSPDEEFGFGDLIDMVNRLHHLPLVGHIYREISGDEIKPIAKIIGGGVFGGPAGAGMGLVDTVVEYETGKSLTGNVASLVTEGKKPTYRSASVDLPEQRLNQAVKSLEENPHDLPGSVIGFTDLGYGKQEVYEKVRAADGRTAGTMVRKYTKVSAPEAAPREPITELNLKPFSFKLESQMDES